MSTSAISFQLAKTINDENEFSIKFTKMYVTVQEAVIIAFVSVMSYPIASMLVGSAGLVAFAIMALTAWIMCAVINNLRKGKPPSYLWDLRYRYGMIPEQRCWMRCSRRKQRVLLRHHQCAPHVFLGGKSARDLLSVDQEWRRAMPPGGGTDRPLIEWPRLCTGRKRLTIETDPAAADPAAPETDDPVEIRKWQVEIHPVEGGYPAPIWFYAPLGFDQMSNHLGHDKVLHITLPMQRTYREQSWGT